MNHYSECAWQPGQDELCSCAGRGKIMKFTLEIELGNDEMQTVSHIKEAINASINETSRKNHLFGKPITKENIIERPFTAIIYDINGNKVGKWEIK